MKSSFFLSCLVFLLYLLLLPTVAESMIYDPDTYWHIATGDLIRSLHSIPQYDSWSLSAGEKHWFITSWSWDVLNSYLYEHTGWHGVIILNSITIAAMLAVLFATCLRRTDDGISAFLATLLAFATLFDFSVRPHQAGLLFIALLMLLLTEISSRRISLRWLLGVPLLMLLWVNIYGGFIIGFFLLGCFTLDASWHKDWRYARMLVLAGALSLAVCLINPTGIMLFHDLINVEADPSKQFIVSWRGLEVSAANIATLTYLLLFFLLVMMRPLPLVKRERWIAYAWLVLSLIWIRHTPIFAVVATPLLALGIHNFMIPKQRPKPLAPTLKQFSDTAARLLANRPAAWGVAVLAIALSAWLFTPAAARLYGTEHFNPLPDLSSEIAYLEKNHPHARLMNSYSLGGPLVFLTHGKIPVFIDGRAGTAYPVRVINDFIAFRNSAPDWEDRLDRYHLDGAIFLSSDHELIDRFISRKGWHLAFRGNTAIIFLRDHR